MSRAAALLRDEPMAGLPVLVVAALEEEIAALRRRMAVTRRETLGRCRASIGSLSGVPVVLATTGDGAENAAAGARALLDRFPASVLIAVGVAGGLTSFLAPGMVLASREVLEEGAAAAPPPDDRWLRRAVRDAGATPASLVTSRAILSTAAAKSAAGASFPSESAAAVDLESASFAREASRRGLPYLVLRAISDPAAESLPLDFDSFRDRSGAVDRRRVAMKALLRPALLRDLLRLRGRVALCSNNLALAVSALLAGDAS